MSAAPIPQGVERLELHGNEYGDLWLAEAVEGDYVRYTDHAAALAASEARVKALQAELEQSEARCMAMFADVAMLGVAEQSLAEALKLLHICASAIDAACPMQGPETRKLRQRIDALLPKGEGATS